VRRIPRFTETGRNKSLTGARNGVQQQNCKAKNGTRRL
jgi:hypothetical protein